MLSPIFHSTQYTLYYPLDSCLFICLSHERIQTEVRRTQVQILALPPASLMTFQSIWPRKENKNKNKNPALPQVAAKQPIGNPKFQTWRRGGLPGRGVTKNKDLLSPPALDAGRGPSANIKVWKLPRQTGPRHLKSLLGSFFRGQRAKGGMEARSRPAWIN